MTHPTDLLKIASVLSPAAVSSCRITAGFDGFVDEMISVVGERQSLVDFSPVADISTFGKLISAAAGHSSLREIVINAVHPGGCAVNLADGLASLGAQVDCFATLGTPIHNAFKEIAAKCRSFHSWGNEPGRTLAFEFSDGKLMFSSVKQLAEFTPDMVATFLKEGSYQESCRGAQVIALTDWTLYPHMTAVWQFLQREVFAQLHHHPHFLLDLVDPSTRSPADILAMLLMLPDFEPCGPLTLGLNGNEANILCRILGLAAASPEATPDETLQQADSLRQKLRISNVVIHRLAYAVSSGPGGQSAAQGPYCPAPKKSTGAGDRFNAGYALGLALNLSGSQSLSLACATSGYFVRNAFSANLDKLVGFLQDWSRGGLGQ